jgi:hypothetical protein
VRIGAPSVPALPVPVDYRREAIGERSARRSERAVATTAEPVVEREVTRIRSRASAQQTGTERVQSFSDALSQRTRSALQSYTSNGPSIEERLGVELAGIDVYA